MSQMKLVSDGKEEWVPLYRNIYYNEIDTLKLGMRWSKPLRSIIDPFFRPKFICRPRVNSSAGPS